MAGYAIPFRPSTPASTIAALNLLIAANVPLGDYKAWLPHVRHALRASVTSVTSRSHERRVANLRRGKRAG